MPHDFEVIERVDGLRLPFAVDRARFDVAVVCRREVWRPRALLRRIEAEAEGIAHWRDYHTAEQQQQLLDLPAPAFPGLYELFERRILDLNQRHFGLELTYWHPMRLTRYEPGSTGHGTHSDYVAPEPAKLAFSLLLQRPRAGGAITVDNHGPAIDLRAGDMVVFAAYEPHSVAPVVEGTRTALTGWLGGPPLR